YGRAVGQDLGRAGHDRRGGKAHADYGVRSLRLSVLDHPLNCLFPGVRHSLDVAADLAADQTLEAGPDVTADVPGADGIAPNDAEHLGYLAAGNLLDRGH